MARCLWQVSYTADGARGLLPAGSSRKGAPPDVASSSIS